MKQKYYTTERIEKVKAQYNILLGERSNGKSYAVKYLCLYNAYKQGNEFIYLRRWQLETKASSVEYYFKDAPVSAITDGKYDTIIVNRGKIYMCRFDVETNTYENKMLVGHVMYLSGETHFKSFSYPKVADMIFEEFVTRDGYLPNECDKLMSLVSTVARRRSIRVWLIGNTISRLNPYFSEWGLRGVPYQKQGTIEVYTFNTSQIDDDGTPISIKIAVEFCENSGNNSKMFFGKSSEMITTGAWETKEYPHLEHSRSEYELLYAVKISHMDICVGVELLRKDNKYVAHVYPSPKKNINREISERFSLSPLVTTDFKIITKGDKILFDLLKRNKIAFSDNLTGSDFSAILKEKGGL